MLGSDARRMVIVAVVAGIVMLTNLGGPRLWDRDEPRNAGCAREMLLRGDWIVPTFNAELRTHKPILLYWLIMSAYSVLGVDEFSARLPSALCALGTCLATYLMGRRLFPATAAMMSGVVLATCVMFVVAGRAATPDSVLIFCTAAAMAVYVCGTFKRPAANTSEQDSAPFEPQLKCEGHYFPQQLGWQVGLYAMMGLAVLAKGPVGLVLPTAVIGMFLLIMRLPEQTSSQPATWRTRLLAIVRPFAPLHFLRTCWHMKPHLAIGVAALVALPWYLAVGIQTDGEFLRGFFFEHNLSRATRPMEGHDGGPLFYPVAILIGTFPWSIFALPLVLDLVPQLRRREPGWVSLVFCLCWMGVFVGMFSLAQTKLPSYVTPCNPAAAMLIGNFLYRWQRGTAAAPAWMPRFGFALLAVIGLGMIVGLPFLARRQLPGEEWLAAIGLAPLAVGIVGALGERLLRRPQTLMAMSGGAIALVTLIFALGAHRVSQHQQNHLMLKTIFAQSAQPKLASFRTLEPTWVFYAERPIVELPRLQPPQQLNQPLTPATSAELGRQQAIDFLNSDPDAFLITTSKRLAELQPHLPPDVEVVSDTPLFLKKERLVALGRKPSPHMAERVKHVSPPQRH